VLGLGNKEVQRQMMHHCIGSLIVCYIIDKCDWYTIAHHTNTYREKVLISVQNQKESNVASSS
jgi:hypothetical protein